MISIFGRLLGARAISAALAFCTSALCAMLLPSSEYASASVAISYASIFSVILYLPFSKYILISGDPEPIESVFWHVQPFIAVVLAVATVGSLFFVPHSPWLALSAAGFVMSQGFRDFTGELLRVENRISAVQWLFVADAATTLTLSILALSIASRSEMMLLASSVSSGFWALWFLPNQGKLPKKRRILATVKDVYLYSLGVVGTNTLNASVIAGARTLVLKNSGADLGAAIQFLLDVLQKPMALVASSINSTVIPVLREQPFGRVLKMLVVTMSAALLALTIMALAFSKGSEVLGYWNGVEISFPVAFSCAFFAWCNRYKTSVMDMPITVSPRYAAWLLLGGAVALLLEVTLAGFAPSAGFALAACGLFMLLGGLASVCVGICAGLCQPRQAAIILVPAIISTIIVWAANSGRGTS